MVPTHGQQAPGSSPLQRCLSGVWASRAALRLHHPVTERPSRAPLGARGSFPTVPGACSIPVGRLMPLPPSWASGLVLVGDKEPFEMLDDVSQGLAVPPEPRGERRGELSASIDGFILYFLSLLSLELLSGKRSQMPGVSAGQGLPPLLAQDHHQQQLARTPAPSHVWRGARWASRLSCGGFTWLVPHICLAGAWAFSLPWLGEGEWVASRDLLTEPNIRVWLPLRLSTCNRFLPSRKSLSGNEEEIEVLYPLPFARAFGNRWVWKYPPKRMPPHRPLGCSRVVRPRRGGSHPIPLPLQLRGSPQGTGG